MTRPRSRHRAPNPRHIGAQLHLRPHPLGLAARDREPVGDTGLGQAHGPPLGRRAGDPHGGAGPVAAAERGEVLGLVPPDDVGPVDRTGPPALGGAGGDGVDHLAHRHGEALGGERGHGLVGDAARDDVAEHRQVGIHVEGEAVHRAAAADADTDRADLARPVRLRRHPHPWVVGQATDVVEAEVSQHVDHEGLDGDHVGFAVRQTTAAPAGDREDRVADQLSRPVVGDVAASVGPDELGAHLSRRAEQVPEVAAHAERVDVRVLEQEQVVVDTLGEQPPLERVGVAVADPPQPADVQRPAGGGARARARRTSHGSR